MSEKVCVVVCNWNRVDDLINCVDSVLKSSYKDFDLVVVENGSEPEIANQVKERLPASAILLENFNNTGGAGGFNRGMQYAIDKGVYQSVWLLDNDVVVDSECLYELLQELRKSDKNGMIGPAIHQLEYPDMLQELGAYIDWNRYDLVSYLKNTSSGFLENRVVNVDYLAACSILADLDKLKEVGLMDEGYFLYFDDAEWCLRFQKRNYSIKASSRAKVWHKGGGSSKKNHLPTYYFWRNRIHFFTHSIRHPNERKDFIHKFIMGELFAALYTAFKLGKMNAFQAGVCGIIDALSGTRGKIKDNRIFPLDDQIFGRFSSKKHKKILVISDSVEHHQILGKYIQMQECLERPVMYYTLLREEGVPSSMRDWAEVRRLQELNQKQADPDQDIFVLSPHIFSSPSSLEKTFQPFLEKYDANVFLFDKYGNLYQGYRAMVNERGQYKRLQKELIEILSPYFEKKMAQLNF